MWFKVKCYDIDYCIEEEDVCDEIADDASIEEDSEEYYEAIHNKIKEIEDRLPKEVILDIDCEEDELDDDLIADELSDETGWLTNSFEYDII